MTGVWDAPLSACTCHDWQKKNDANLLNADELGNVGKRMGQLEMYRHPRSARMCGLVAAFCAVVLLAACDSPKPKLSKVICTMGNGDIYHIAISDTSNVRINNRLLTDGGTVTIEDLLWNVAVSATNDHTVVNMQHAIGASSLSPASQEINYDLDSSNGTLTVEVLRAGNRERRRIGKCVKED